jgi:leader peptidase (prepilin peptidase)/N-methyltransferase
MLDANWWIIIIAVILGLVIGSFLNVVIYRLPLMLKNFYVKDYNESLQQLKPEVNQITLSTPGSHCPGCKKRINWWHNIPLLSYLWLRGNCYNCKMQIDWRYPLVELSSGVATLLLVMHFPLGFKMLAAILLTWSLITAVFIDLEEQLLPDQITLPLIWLGLLLNSYNIFTLPSAAVIGASSAYLSLWLINRGFMLVRKMEGMGHGDFKLFAVFGAWFGWQPLPVIILIASAMGVLVGLLMVVIKKHSFSQPFPFGPYLAIAGWITLWWF